MAMLGMGVLLGPLAQAQVESLGGQKTAEGFYMKSWRLKVPTIKEAPFALVSIEIERIGDPEGGKQPAREYWEKLIYRPGAKEFVERIDEEYKLGPRPRLKKTDRFRVSTQLRALNEPGL